MKIKVVLTLCLSLFLVGCSSVDKENPDGEGYVFDESNGRVLILSNVDSENIEREWNDIFETYQGEAIWLTTNKSGLKKGQYIRYWIDGGVNDSFPQQAKAKKIEILKK